MLKTSSTATWPLKKYLLQGLSLTTVAALLTYQYYFASQSQSHNSNSYVSQCPGPERLQPSFNSSLNEILFDPTYKKQSIERLSKAIQIPTEVQDKNPDPKQDPNFYKEFVNFHNYLSKTYPLVHKHLKRETVNEFGLLFTWEGSETDLKPALFMAHQDVVPVNRATWDEWEYPPFSGHYDPETDLIWGRGSNDCKNVLTAQLESIEKLLSDGFKPRRTLLVSFGFDEEASGIWGATFLSKFISNRYGDDSLLVILDEGEGVVKLDDKTYLASVINGEKGYVNVDVTIMGHGGHSSAPPDHTTIGVAADLITTLENDPFKSDFQLDNPLYGSLICSAEHSSLLADDVKDLIFNANIDDEKRKQLTDYLSKQSSMRSLIKTTQAIDIINGGVKSNALPEQTYFLINHRIDFHSSVNETVERDLSICKEIALKFGYGLKFSDETIIEPTELGFIQLNFHDGLEPAPVSPNHGDVWDVLSGTMKDVFDTKFNNEKELYVTTGVFSGNTDTKYYWNLTKNIYRFVGSIYDRSALVGVHSVNEAMNMDAHLSSTAFFYDFILNVNEHL